MDTNLKRLESPAPPGACRPQRNRLLSARSGVLLGGVLAVCLVAGCASGGAGAADATRIPRNVYVEPGRIPAHVKRVAVLPLAISEPHATLEEGRIALQPILLSELLASARLEFVTVTPEQCRAWTGQPQWLASDQLPRELLDKVRSSSGSDAILFAQLTRYHPYPPVAVGWRLQLLSLEPPRVLWAVDEMFDGGDSAVADAARSYYKKHWGGQTGSDPQTILSSPRRFGQYTSAAMVGTLPER